MTLLRHLFFFQIFDRVIQRAPRGAQTVSQALALLDIHRGNRNANAAQRGRDVVHIIHGANKFTRCKHEGSCLFGWLPVRSAPLPSKTWCRPNFYFGRVSEFSKGAERTVVYGFISSEPFAAILLSLVAFTC